MKADRSRSAPETKRKLIEAAVKLMLGKGFTATTVDEICTQAGLTKGSFFHYFDTKEDLAKTTAEYFHQCQQQMFDGADFRSLADPFDRVHGRLDFLTTVARNPDIPKCCLIGTLAQEVSATHESIRCVCDERQSILSATWLPRN